MFGPIIYTDVELIEMILYNAQPGWRASWLPGWLADQSPDLPNPHLAALALQCSFLIQFLLRNDDKSSFSCLGSSCIHVLFDSYLEVMINPRLTTLAPYVSIPHLVLTQNAMYPLVSKELGIYCVVVLYWSSSKCSTKDLLLDISPEPVTLV